MDILGGQAVQAVRLISKLRDEQCVDVSFLPVNPRLPGVLGVCQQIKYLRTVVTSIVYVLTLLLRVPQSDVLHVFSASYFSFVLAPTPAIVIGKIFGKRVLLNYHSGEAEDHLTRWSTARATLRLVEKVVVPSPYLVRVFAKFGVSAQAINNIIDLEKFTFRKRSSLNPVFLSNRNLESHYGVDVVLKAFARIQQRYPAALLTVVGDGSERAQLEELANELQLRNVRFLGRVSHDRIVQTYQTADVYLNASRIDNQPLSILEAFACGLPVVTTNAGGIRDLVDDNATASVVPIDDHESLANRAVQLLDDTTLAHRLTENGLRECARYSWKAVRAEWLELYCRNQQQPSARRRTQLTKLRQMSFDELRVRATQKLNVFAERSGLSRQTRLPSDSELIRLLSPTEFKSSSIDHLQEHFQTRTHPNFFAGLSNPQSTAEEFRQRWPNSAQEIIEAAERITNGKFDLLGLKNLDFGNPINWHLEPTSNKSVPLAHWSDIDYLNPEIAGDKKIIWELNRQQYFITLGRAYWLTQNETYATTFVEHLNSWIDANPPKQGINWASSLEVAFRSIAWLWALHFFKNSPSVSAKTFARAFKVLYLNAKHLETHLSTYFSPNTHLTGEALGLFYLGMSLPEFRESDRWRSVGLQVLLSQLSRQVRPDGVYFEQSTYYHRYTTDFYIHLLILNRANNLRVAPEVEAKLQMLLDHLMYITRPDGSTPMIGDDDGGRLMKVDQCSPNDFRAALSTGATVFNRGDYKFVAGEFAEESFWLLGPEGAAKFDQLSAGEPASTSIGFSDGGYYVMRDDWSREANYLLFDCGPHGTGNGGHAHADALSVELVANGRPLIVDPGTYTYTGSKDLRNWFRTSSAHNAVVVDGQSSSVPDGPFSWKTKTNCSRQSWIAERRFTYVAGSHNGYLRLPEPITHIRSILFLKHDYWLIRDQLIGAGKHEIQLRFHLTNDAKLNLDELPKAVTEEGFGLQFFAMGAEGRWSREDGWISHCYQERVAAPVCVFSASIDGPAELITVLRPVASDGEVANVAEVEAIGGKALEIQFGNYTDLVMLRDVNATRVETVRMVSDFQWTWSRFEIDNDEPAAELLVLNGQRLELDGTEILKANSPVNYVMASKLDEQFQVETSQGKLKLNFPVKNLDQLFANASLQS